MMPPETSTEDEQRLWRTVGALLAENERLRAEVARVTAVLREQQEPHLRSVTGGAPTFRMTLSNSTRKAT